MTLKTILYEEHIALGGKMVDFSGWQMPLHYGSQIEEHHQVRRAAGMFDVSHMMVVDLNGTQVREFMRFLLANDVGPASTPGKAMYSCMLNEQGGVIDDLIVYDRGENGFRMVLNAATRDKDLAWINRQTDAFDVTLQARFDLAMIAVQGPDARDRVLQILGDTLTAAIGLKPFFSTTENGFFIARTGYTGEDGFEIILPEERAADLWRQFHRLGVKACGLGARDTLRLEAGMNLYGSEMDENSSPLESGLAWTVAWQPAERNFIGRAALEAQRDVGLSSKLAGLVLDGRGMLRNNQRVLCERGEEGRITSGSFSPTLGKAIALARLPLDAGKRCEVEIRGKRVPATVVDPPFVRNGKPCIQTEGVTSDEQHT